MKNAIHYRLRVWEFVKIYFFIPPLLIAWLIGQGGQSVWAHGLSAGDKPGTVFGSDSADAVDHADHSKMSSLSKGATVYKHMCIYCHGIDGNGGGKATAYLYPWPRDFRKGVFKHRTTPSGTLPLDKDIYRTIMRGVPGSSMPSWQGALSEEEAWSVVQYIKGFSKRFQLEEVKQPIDVTKIPDSTDESVAQGKKLYKELSCSRCHGTDLKGSGSSSDSLYDIWNHRVFIYDLTNPNAYKFGFSREDIYTTISTGIDGTPMKSYHNLSDAERWSLVDFVNSKIRLEKLQKEKYEIELTAQRVETEIDLDPFNSLWDTIPLHKMQMIPLSARNNPVNRVQLQAVINADAIAFRLEWEDATENRSSSRHEDFKDAVAMEFALGDTLLHKHGHNEPFFGMGNRGKVVNIWQWRADWQTEIETKEKLKYATEGLDLDTMIFGGEVNPVEALNPFRDVPVEEMNAEGFGTLTPQPQTKQNVLGKGVWKDGKWQVVLYRSLESLNKWDVKFERERPPILIAFAIWDGALQDRNGRKVVSMWQQLRVP
jgi:mono/diheme cytochrome c family protein